MNWKAIKQDLSLDDGKLSRLVWGGGNKPYPTFCIINTGYKYCFEYTLKRKAFNIKQNNYISFQRFSN